ncbi:hypothetical protein Tco_0398098 [Tanacetum coccineum]
MDGGCEVDGCVWGDKDGEDVIIEGDGSSVVSMDGNSRMSTLEYLLEALLILLNSFCVRVGVRKAIRSDCIPHESQLLKNFCSKERANTIRIFKLEMSSNKGLKNKYLDLLIYGSSDSPDPILSYAQSSSLPKLFYRRSIKGWAFSEGILDVTCS